MSTKKEKPDKTTTSSSTTTLSTPSKTKVIRQPGSSIERVAQACDRCRLKKTRCDGKRPQCSQCASVGFECKISDKLSRRAFPRGYTETLEERVRELENENKRLLALLDLRDEQMELLTKNNNNVKPLSSSNLSILNSKKDNNNNNNYNNYNNNYNNNTNSGPISLLNEYIDHDPKHVHSGPGCCSNYPHSVHERPVSIAGSVDLDNGDLTDEESILSSLNEESNAKASSFIEQNQGFNIINGRKDFISFEQNMAPGLPAALAIANMNKNNNNSNNNSNNNNNNTINDQKAQLATLVSMSIPRSTEETLFIPSLLSKIGETHGFKSKPSILTASTISSLKEIPRLNEQQKSSLRNSSINFANLNFINISQPESNLFFSNLKLPSKIQLDQLITLYFQEWGTFLPIIDKNDFIKQYLDFSKSLELNFLDNTMIHKEKFGALLILTLQLTLLSSKYNDSNDEDLIHYYDHLIHELINSSIANQCNMQSLQILSLALYYCLNIGDVITSYALRGRVITMAQQLRLHRCPSAVLGSNGSIVSKQQQAERRILFWCIYSLDAFASLQLGVPRLLKDYEIECALPFGNDDDTDKNDINFIVVNDSKISLVGKVLNFSLSIMRYSKVLGNVLDSIFKRHSYNKDGNVHDDNLYEVTFYYENLLDSWRRDLPTNLKFEMDVNGLSTKSNNKETPDTKKSLLIMLYYIAKILIHLPVIATEAISTDTIQSRGSSSNMVIQQCSISLLNNLSELYSERNYYLPVPINIIRYKVRLALLSAKGSLDYTRGGSLFQESKNLLTKIINELKRENLKFNNLDYNIPGNISIRCLKLLETAVESILAPKETIKKERRRSSSTSSTTARSQKNISNPSPLSQQSTKNNISTPTKQPPQQHDELSQMLSQLQGAPPPIVSNGGLNDQRVPKPRSGSISHHQHQHQHQHQPYAHQQPQTSLQQPQPQPQHQPQHQPQQPEPIKIEDSDFDLFKFNEIDLDLINQTSEGFDNVELEFGADGSLGLAPWLDDTKEKKSANSLFDWQNGYSN